MDKEEMHMQAHLCVHIPNYTYSAQSLLSRGEYREGGVNLNDLLNCHNHVGTRGGGLRHTRGQTELPLYSLPCA